jgi:hypothetical protein
VRELAWLVHGVGERDWLQANPSIFNGETFPDFIYSLVQRIKSGVKASVVKVKDIPACEKSENPVMTFDVDEYLLDRTTDKNNNVPQNVHRIPRSQKMTFRSWKTGVVERGISPASRISVPAVQALPGRQTLPGFLDLHSLSLSPDSV